MELELVAGSERLIGRSAATVDEHAAEVDRGAPGGLVGMAEPSRVKAEHACARGVRCNASPVDETLISRAHAHVALSGAAA